MVYPLLPLFLTRVLGRGAMSLGVVEGIAEAANSALKIISGRLRTRAGGRSGSSSSATASRRAVRPFIAIASTWTHVLGIRFADRLGKGIRGAPRDAMLAEFAAPEQRGRVYGFHRAMDHAGAVLGPLIAAVFLVFLSRRVPHALRADDRPRRDRHRHHSGDSRTAAGGSSALTAAATTRPTPPVASDFLTAEASALAMPALLDAVPRCCGKRFSSSLCSRWGTPLTRSCCCDSATRE